MKKVIVLACAAFFSGQLMAQTTAKATEAVQAKTTEPSKEQVDVMSAKAEVVTSVITATPDLAQKAPAVITDTKVKEQKTAAAVKQETPVELSKVAPAPATVKAAPVKQ
jgi:cellobiose-specific phosphotransferase system component IIB